MYKEAVKTLWDRGTGQGCVRVKSDSVKQAFDYARANGLKSATGVSEKTIVETIDIRNTDT